MGDVMWDGSRMDLDAHAWVGCTSTTSLTVTPAATAIAAGSGDLPVLATPRLIALMEEAACAALAPRMPAELTSVGTHVDVVHLAPSALGTDVTATATVTAVEGSRVDFDFIATQTRDGSAVVIGRGTHTRVVIDRERFLSRL